MTTPRLSRSAGWRHEFIRRNGARCHYCNRPGTQDMGPDDRPWWIDHMDPIARGGPDVEENLALACKRCNLAKGVKPYEQFKEFAAAAFWVPDDWRASEFDLDDLMSLHTGALRASRPEDADPTWHLDGDRGSIVAIGYAEHLREMAVMPIVHLSEEVSHEMSPRCRDYVDGKDILRFLLRAQELIPALIAEIRMLRAETNAGSGGVSEQAAS